MIPITKYTSPTTLDSAPYGSLWKEVLETKESEEKYIVYQQTSRKDEHPKWVKVSEMLDVIFSEFYLSTDFSVKCLYLYNYACKDGQIVKDLFNGIE